MFILNICQCGYQFPRLKSAGIYRIVKEGGAEQGGIEKIMSKLSFCFSILSFFSIIGTLQLLKSPKSSIQFTSAKTCPPAFSIHPTHLSAFCHHSPAPERPPRVEDCLDRLCLQWSPFLLAEALGPLPVGTAYTQPPLAWNRWQHVESAALLGSGGDA